MKQYGKVISKLRKENNMTQAELGAKLNVTYQAVSKWENDQSQPDFATMVEMAKLFNVPLNVFVDENTETVTDNIHDDPVIGYCKTCGIAVRKENLAQERPYILCKDCFEDLAKQEKEAREKAEADEAERIRKEKEDAVAADKRNKHVRDKGLIWSAVITGILLAIGIISVIITGKNIPVTLFGVFGGAIFCYTFIAQLFWKGFIAETCLFGGKIVGMPGVIFTFDLDGFIFLIAMKILFAFLRMTIFIATFLISACFAIICSPFTFVPAMLRVRRYGLDND